MTTYVVLRVVSVASSGSPAESPARYEVIKGAIAANSDLVAVRRAVAQLPRDERSGEFVAVPKRSFKPRKLMVETVQKELWT
jgi:hypothetical protein